jgi:hypothetical protein
MNDNESFEQPKSRSYAFNENISDDIAEFNFVVIKDETKN